MLQRRQTFSVLCFLLQRCVAVAINTARTERGLKGGRVQTECTEPVKPMAPAAVEVDLGVRAGAAAGELEAGWRGGEGGQGQRRSALRFSIGTTIGLIDWRENLLLLLLLLLVSSSYSAAASSPRRWSW